MAGWMQVSLLWLQTMWFYSLSISFLISNFRSMILSLEVCCRDEFRLCTSIQYNSSSIERGIAKGTIALQVDFWEMASECLSTIPCPLPSLSPWASLFHTITLVLHQLQPPIGQSQEQHSRVHTLSYHASSTFPLSQSFGCFLSEKILFKNKLIDSKLFNNAW